MIQFKYIIGLGTAAISLTAFADPAGKDVSIDTQDWSYAVPRSNYYPGHTAQLIDGGNPIGVFTSHPINGGTLPKSIADLFTNVEQAQASQAQSVGAQRDKIRSEIKSPAAVPVASRATPVIPPAASSSAAETAVSSDAQWNDFKSCALQALPQLKKLIRIGVAKENSKAAQIQKGIIKKDLDAERGDGTSVSPLGMACGKHLGPAGFPVESLADDVRTLVTLTQTPAGVETLALRSAWLAHRSETPQPSVRLWKLSWTLLSIRTVFSGAAISTYELLKKEISAVLSAPVNVGGQPGVQIQFSASEVESKMDSGWELAAGKGVGI